MLRFSQTKVAKEECYGAKKKKKKKKKEKETEKEKVKKKNGMLIT